MQEHNIILENPLRLESGHDFSKVVIRYHTSGEYHPEAKVVWVNHALTGNSNVFEWWEGLFGENDFFNPQEYFIICANCFGSCYGSSSPLSTETNEPQYNYHCFPEFTIRDMVHVNEMLRKHLGIEKIHAVIGGSIGGQMCVEWGIMKPKLIENLILVATTAQSSPWCIALNESQRMAIECDATWKDSNEEAGLEGMKVARTIALLSYRTYEIYKKSQLEINDEVKEDFKASSYQRYQGEKLAVRFNAFSYHRLTKAMDSHNVGRKRGNKPLALAKIEANTLIIGFTSDLLFPLSEQAYLAKHIKNASFETVESEYGHDGFLVHTKEISEICNQFFQSQINANSKEPQKGQAGIRPQK